MPSDEPKPDDQQFLANASGQVSTDQFLASRGKAVQAYARLEQALCRIFADISGTAPQIAAIIFFRIQSTRARNDVLDKLLRLRYGPHIYIILEFGL